MKFRLLLDSVQVPHAPFSRGEYRTTEVKYKLISGGFGPSVSGDLTLYFPGNQFARFETRGIIEPGPEFELPIPAPARPKTDVERAMDLVQQASDAIPFGAGDGIRGKLCDAHALLRKVATNSKQPMRKVVLDNGCHVWSDKAIGEFQEIMLPNAVARGGYIIREVAFGEVPT